MDAAFSSSLNALIDAGNASGHPLSIESGDRDTATQTSLWNAAVAKYGPDEAPNWVAPPGHSNHEKGIAADLSGDLDWAQAHAADYGLYFPLANENWHIEPIGSRGDNSTSGSYVTGTTGPTVAGSITKTPKSTDAFNVILDMLGVGKGSLGGAAGSTITVNPRSQQPQSGTLLDSGPPPTISSANGFQSQLDRFMALTREHESSGNYRAVGPSTPWGNATGAYQFLDCVTMDSECLTQRGWTKYEDMKVGDKTLGIDPHDNMLHWTPILNVGYWSEREVVRISNDRWSATVTPNHRWWSDIRKPTPIIYPGLVCPDCGVSGTKRGRFVSARAIGTHRAKKHGWSTEPVVYQRLGEWVQTESVSPQHRLVLSAKACTDNNDTISLDEAEILGWIMGDGHIRHKPHFSVEIYQSKPYMVDALEKLLYGTPHFHSRRQRHVGWYESHTFHLEAKYARNLLARSQYETGLERFVLSLGTKQRARFLYGFLQAEGTTFNNLQTFAQVQGPKLEAAVLAVYLEGYCPTRRLISLKSEKYNQTEMVVLARPWVGGTALKVEPLGLQPVWCVRTSHGTWTMRQNGIPMLTGNTTWNYYGGYARAADAPPEVQDARARDLMTQYYNQFGDWGSVAGAWFAGPGGDFSTDEVQGYINWMNARL